MSGRGAGGQRCQLILQRCLAIHLTKPGNAPDDFWMYDSGYLLFQSFLAANAKCWWAGALAAATAELRYAGYVAPGVLLVGGAPRALETVRGAYSRSVLKPPPTYLICGLGDIEDCIVTPTYQGQFTPLPEALCDCIMDLTTQGQSATLESIRTSLSSKFPSMQTPSQEVVYDTLAQLMQERKIYQTSRGFFIVTPERRRSRSRSSSRHHSTEDECSSPRTILMSDQEALHQLYGEITTVRDGAVTHQCVQTNLADVICGGNPNDKVLYGRPNKRRSASFPAPRSLDRRHSLRIFGSSSKYLQRCASTRSLHHKHNTTDSSSSTDYPPSVESASPKKVSLLSRLFRRSGRSKQTRAMSTFSAQFPPTEWFNSKAVHLHCVATQTDSKESLQSQTSIVSSYYDGSEISNRSSTLPRRHKRHLSTESGLATSMQYDHSPVRQSSPSSGSLPRSTLSRSSTNKTILDHFGSPQRNSEPKLRDSPNGSLRRVDYSDNLMSTSGPSSLESNTHRTPRKDYRNGQSDLNSPMKRGYHTSGSSGHSSLESHISDRTLKPSPSHTNGNAGLSRAQSLVKVQSLQSSPKSLHKCRTKPPIVGGETVKNGKSTSPRTSPKNCPNTPKKTATPLHNKTLGSKVENPATAMLASSNSNNSITLKVTTNTLSQNGGTNTKVYVQNSPVRSVITFENGKITETSNGSNIYIINDDRQVVSVSQNGVSNQTTKNPTETSFDVCVEKKKQLYQEPDKEKVQENKFNKNSINDTRMNNNRKLSLQIGGVANNNSFIYKNQLNNTNDVASNPSSPAIHNNIHNIEASATSNPSTPTKTYDNVIGSLGNLRYQKNSLTTTHGGIHANLNTNTDLKSVDLLKKAAALQMLNGLPNIHNRMSSESIANLLSKGIDQKPTVLGSEPNLALKNQEVNKDINISSEKIHSLENKQKRYSLSQDGKKEHQDFYNFPSLSDLSFNFTSLAAQKILKGVSINSVDTLVELNMAANNTEKQNNRDVAAVCTDFGLV
ncbi:M-phase inducer phosphatase [Danaus plexippus]|uniref:M-phase inducer phosphatase n=1 Tax=Danaus plexippus TaxID=13037 RepID=UPI002AB1C39C|nr:M-phase inducer phosphatase [Danaus plexippus]XP_032510985.2 M-phase inducer phosphatase [Danaus plexippus]